MSVSGKKMNLPSSAKRRLQYNSQLPVCSRRQPAAAKWQLQKNHKSQQDLALKNRAVKNLPKIPGQLTPMMSRKSLSMIDLQAGGQEDSSESERNGIRSPSALSLRSTESNSRSDLIFSREARAASIICRTLAVNAWRRGRQEIVHLRNLEKGLNIQIVVLRRLLENENSRIGILSTELQGTKTSLDEVSKKKDSAEMEAGKLKIAVENLRNDLGTAKDQLKQVEEQMSKDREKRILLKEEKDRLIHEIAEKQYEIERFVNELEDSQIQLATQITLNTSLREEISRMAIELNNEQERNSCLELDLKSRDDRIRDLRLELSELREDRLWSNRVLRLAGSVVRAPQVLLSFLVTTGILTTF